MRSNSFRPGQPSYAKTSASPTRSAVRANRLAGALRDAGVKAGDRVAFLSMNCHRLLEAYYGVLAAGAVLLPLNFRLAPQAEAGIPRRHISSEEIVDRCIYGLVNEGARILEEGIALRAVDIDIIYLNGYGFPAYRGGPMWYADTVGLKKVYDRVREFRDRHGEQWEPAPLLKELAETGRTFASLNKAQTVRA